MKKRAADTIQQLVPPRPPKEPSKEGEVNWRWEADQVIAKKYRIVTPIGCGGMGQVYKAYDNSLGRFVAIKVFVLANPEREPTEEELDDYHARFHREATTVAGIKHENVVLIYSVEEDDEGVPYMVMPFLEGMCLEEYIRHYGTQRVRIPDGKNDIFSAAFSVDQVRMFLGPIARGLMAVHGAGVLHRDLKSGNIFMQAAASLQPPIPQIIDFGIAKSEMGIAPLAPHDGDTKIDARPTGTCIITGTVEYMPPEQLVAEVPILPTHRWVDLYALGAIVYEMLTGFPPYSDHPKIREAESPVAKVVAWTGVHTCLFAPFTPIAQLRPDLMPSYFWLDEFFARALARDPKQRFQTAEDFLATFEHCIEQTSTRDSLRGPPRGSIVAASVVLVLALLVIGAVIRSNLRQGAPPARHVVSASALTPIPQVVTISVPLPRVLVPGDVPSEPVVVVDAGQPASIIQLVPVRRSHGHPPRPRQRCGQLDRRTGTIIPCL